MCLHGNVNFFNVCSIRLSLFRYLAIDPYIFTYVCVLDELGSLHMRYAVSSIQYLTLIHCNSMKRCYLFVIVCETLTPKHKIHCHRFWNISLIRMRTLDFFGFSNGFLFVVVVSFLAYEFAICGEHTFFSSSLHCIVSRCFCQSDTNSFSLRLYHSYFVVICSFEYCISLKFIIVWINMSIWWHFSSFQNSVIVARRQYFKLDLAHAYTQTDIYGHTPHAIYHIPNCLVFVHCFIPFSTNLTQYESAPIKFNSIIIDYYVHNCPISNAETAFFQANIHLMKVTSSHETVKWT